MPKFLLVFVSVVYNNNFSIKYIHLKSHLLGKLSYEVYNWPIGWRNFIFLGLLSLLVSHNEGSNTVHILGIWNECMCTHNKISHLEGLQSTTSSRSVALTSAWCTRTLCLPPTTFLLMWLWSKIHSAVMAGTQTTWFLTRNEHKIYYLEGFQRIFFFWLGALTSAWCTRILCYPPTTFLFLWLKSKLDFAVVVFTKITIFFIKMNTKYLIWKGSNGKLFLIWCGSLHREY